MLEIENISFRYAGAEKQALTNLSLQVGEGDILGILGPNGAGKTTLLRLILGLLRPQQGQILLSGQDNSGLSPERRHEWFGSIGAHLENPGLYRNLSPREYLRFFAEIQGLEISASELDKLCLGFQLDPIGVRCGKLSQGNRQKLHLARTLLGRPRFLLWDEPTDHLDPTVQILALNLLKSYVSGTGRAAIVASHRIEHLEKTCSHIIILDQGQIKVQDTLQHLLGTACGIRIHWDPKAWPASLIEAFHLESKSVPIPAEAGNQGLTRGVWIESGDPNVLPELLSGLVNRNYRIGHAALIHPKLEDIYHSKITSPETGNPFGQLHSEQVGQGIERTAPSTTRARWSTRLIWILFKHELRLVRREPRFFFPFILISLGVIGTQIFMFTRFNPASSAPDWPSIQSLFALLGVVASSLCIPMGADSFAGEKERNSLEILWISTRHPAAIFYGKALALMPFSVLLGWAGQGILLGWMISVGTDFQPYISQILGAFSLTLAWALFTGSMSIALSSRAATVRSATQGMAPLVVVLFVLVPWIEAFLLQETIYWIAALIVVALSSYVTLKWSCTRWMKKVRFG